jgi:hypothetical protein
VAKAVESNPRTHAAAHFGLGLAISSSNAWRELAIAHFDVHGPSFYAEVRRCRMEAGAYATAPDY